MDQKELEPRKLFIGGIPRSGFDAHRMKCHFAVYGYVVDAMVMQFPDGLGRGFGFVEFEDEAAALRALDPTQRARHDRCFGCKVDVKKAEKKQGTRSPQTQSSTYNRNADSKKIFVGGLGDKLTKQDLLDYFGNFGTITDAVVMYDKVTLKARGFGFVTFDSQEATDKVLESSFHYLKGTKVETKNAEPRDHYGHYHGSMAWKDRGYSSSSPAYSYGGIYSPHNAPFVPYSPYLFAYPYPYPYPYAPPRIVNYEDMMNQAGTSNDTGMTAMQAPPVMYPHYYGRPYGYDAASVKLQSDSKVKGNQQKIDIPDSTDMKPNPVKPDSNLL